MHRQQPLIVTVREQQAVPKRHRSCVGKDYIGNDRTSSNRTSTSRSHDRLHAKV
ncbi:hypothetical protein B296_00038882, partial [Ensete ventricosum]